LYRTPCALPNWERPPSEHLAVNSYAAKDSP
jgi:hypothetical protein